jgi:hypothetical protein
MSRVLLVWVLLSCASCGRPSSHSAKPVALPPGEVESLFARDAAPTANPMIPSAPMPSPWDLSEPPRIGGGIRKVPTDPDRGAVPILYDRGEVSPGFARAAPPSTAHPRGTIAVEVRFFDRPGSTHGNHDAKILEVDLATGAHVRTLDMGREWIGSFLLDGAGGPIEVMWKSTTIEVFWFDKTLAPKAHRSLVGVYGDPHDSAYTGKEVVGDRVVFAFADGSFEEPGSRTNVWLLDSSGTVIKRTCAAHWRPEADILENGDDVLVEPIAGEEGLSLCALRADGTGKVRSQPYHASARIVRVGRKAYFSVSYDDDAGLRLPPGLYPVGSDLLPVQPAMKDPTPPEEIAADQEFHEDPTLVNGTIVLVRSPCCGNGGPYVWLLDPRSLPDGGNETATH